MTYISTEEAAKILGVGVQRVRDLCLAESKKAGTGIKGKKFGVSWMVDTASVEKYRSRPERRGRKPKPKAKP